MDQYLQAAGEAYNHKQDVAGAKHMRSDGEPRSFRICLAASGSMVEQSLEQTRSVMTSSEEWQHMLACCRTSALRSRATLMLSKGGSGLYKLQQEHLNYQVSLFILLLDPSMASTIAADLCRMDPWSLEFVLYHRSKDGLDSAMCLDELRALAHMWELEMASVEAFHASIRRLQHIVSVQTHGEAMQDASAEWLLRCVRMLVRDHRLRGAEGGPAVEGSDAKDGKQPKPLAKKGSGGPWRAFIREATLGCKGTPDFSDLSSRYRELSAEQKGHFLGVGRAATRVAKLGLAKGGGAFGLSTREQLRVVRRRARKLLVDQMVAESVPNTCTDGAGLLCGDIATSGSPAMAAAVDEAQSGLRLLDPAEICKVASLEREAKRVQAQADANVIREFHRSMGHSLCKDTLSIAPSAEKLRADEFRVSPDRGFTVLQWAPV